jgi:toxin ParE1/3/4
VWIVWTARAVAHVDALGAYLRERNPAAASHAIGAIESGVARLVEHRLRGRVGRLPGTRELVIPRTPYLVAYRIVSDGIQVLAVIHGARRWPRNLEATK